MTSIGSTGSNHDPTEIRNTHRIKLSSEALRRGGVHELKNSLCVDCHKVCRHRKFQRENANNVEAFTGLIGAIDTVNCDNDKHSKSKTGRSASKRRTSRFGRILEGSLI